MIESVFWNCFFSSDKKLLNTPIYEAILKKYVNIYNVDYNTYYKNQLKAKFSKDELVERIIRRISNDKSIKRWVKKYLNENI